VTGEKRPLQLQSFFRGGFSGVVGVKYHPNFLKGKKKRKMKKLLIVESPAKAKTIAKYLGPDFVVKSSVGHVRDLPKKGLSIKIEPDASNPSSWVFKPNYEVSADKKKVVDDLVKAAKAADEIYLAPDPDREGEAIAWHLSQVLASATKGKPVRRVTYNEITKNAVRAAVANPGEIDLARVDAQQARRILDRLVGFKVSPMLWRKLNYGYSLSAGRVQSVALRLLVEREREIGAFVPEAYWVMGVEAAKKGAENASFTAKLSRLDGEKPDVRSQEKSAMIVDDLDGASLRVSYVKTQPKTRHPYPPFTTSTLQQAASSVCGFTPHRTMSIAQKLYEAGLITYMRTDSVNVAAVARTAAAETITAIFGKEYVPETPNFYKSKSGAQEAHEAIRPTDVSQRPDGLDLDSPSMKLYDLIWRRFLASQMASARLTQTTVGIEAEKDSLRHTYLFTATTTQTTFDGFLAVMKTSRKKAKEEADEDSDEVDSLPQLAEGDALVPVRWLSERKETKPPPRYSEAALVKTLEENGVGRPSTYAQTIEVLVDRQYATREDRQLVPTQRGMDVNDWLVQKLEPLFNVGYTAQMEEDLDKVETGEEKGDGMLSGFYRKFTSWLSAAEDPAPPPEKFQALFSILDRVKTWKPPVKVGRRTYSDELFVKSVKEKFATSPESLSARQLDALVKLAVAYGEQLPGAEMELIDLGYGPEIDRIKNAPSEELVKWCFQTIDRIGGLTKNPFLNSLREQVDRGRLLSPKQFSILARSVGENAGALPDAEQVRSRLAPYVPGGFETAPVDPAVPELLALLEKVQEWKEPARRGRRVYNDQEFVASLREQYARRSSLSPRQVLALRRVCVGYRDQIPGYDEVADRLGLKDLPAHEKPAKAEADAKADARAERKARRSRRS